MASIFDKMINEILNESTGSQMLEDCMSFDVNIAKKVHSSGRRQPGRTSILLKVDFPCVIWKRT